MKCRLVPAACPQQRAPLVLCGHHRSSFQSEIWRSARFFAPRCSEHQPEKAPVTFASELLNQLILRPNF